MIELILLGLVLAVAGTAIWIMYEMRAKYQNGSAPRTHTAEVAEKVASGELSATDQEVEDLLCRPSLRLLHNK